MRFENHNLLKTKIVLLKRNVLYKYKKIFPQVVEQSSSHTFIQLSTNCRQFIKHKEKELMQIKVLPIG